MKTIDDQVAELMVLVDHAAYVAQYEGLHKSVRTRAAVEAFARAALERRSNERPPLVWPALEKETP